jgi:hypothetical protein
MNRWHCPSGFARWVVADFEYARGSTGDALLPTCMVAYELESGDIWRLWREKLQALKQAPFEVGPDTLLIGFKTESEVQCFLSLGWRLPCHVLDLYAEWRWRSNGAPHPPPENSLINVASRYGIDTMTAAMKDKFRQQFIDDLPFTPEQREEALDYNQADVKATAAVYLAMERQAPFHLPTALLRGRFVKAAARIQHVGVPLDQDLVRRFDRHRLAMRALIIDEGDRVTDKTGKLWRVYDDCHHFSDQRFHDMLRAREVKRWPLTDKKQGLKTDHKTLKRMARQHPWFRPWQEMNELADLLENWKLQCGTDGFNRYSVMPFGTKTGRNNPSSNRYIFGMPGGFRPLIKPHPGAVIVYCDWSAMEIGIAAALSRDPALLASFVTGDPYVAFAMRAGLALEAAKQVRKQYKEALLGVCYGMGAHTLAGRLGIEVEAALTLLQKVRQLYPVFWAWCHAVICHANRYGELVTPCDKWRFQVHAKTKQTTLRNYMMQASGASIMRFAAIAATEERLRIGGIVHDAFLLVSKPGEVERDTAHLLEIMAEAAELVCGIPIPAERTVICYPERYWDPGDGKACDLWRRLIRLLERVENEALETVA